MNHEAVVAHVLEGALEAKVGGARLWPSIEALPVPLRVPRVPLLSSVEHVGCIDSLIADAPREGLIRKLFGEVWTTRHVLLDARMSTYFFGGQRTWRRTK